MTLPLRSVQVVEDELEEHDELEELDILYGKIFFSEVVPPLNLFEEGRLIFTI